MEPLNLQSLKYQVYELLKAEILRGRLQPGMRILEREIGVRHGISRTPIREALLQLAHEGLVVVAQRRGIFVAHRTLDEIEEIYMLLGILEGAAAVRAIRRMGKPELDRLAALTRQLGDAAARRDISKFVELNVQCHAAFLDACGSPRLRAMCGGLREQLHQYPLRMLAFPGWMERSLAEHRGILRAFVGRRERQIEGIMRRHWRFKQPRAALLRVLARTESDLHADMLGGAHQGGTADTEQDTHGRGASHGADGDDHPSRRQAISARHRPRARVRAGQDPHR